jgi:hypothetical protein
MEIVPQRIVGDFAQRAGQFDAGRSAANDYESEPGVALRGVRLALGLFIGQQNAAADFGRVFHGLKSGREGLPLVMAEIGIRGAGRDHQVVIGPLAIGQDHATVGDIEIHYLSEQHFRVAMAAQDRAQRRCDLTRRKPAGGHLVQQRLKEMKIAAIDQGERQRNLAETLSGVKAGETAADNDHAVRADASPVRP